MAYTYSTAKIVNGRRESFFQSPLMTHKEAFVSASTEFTELMLSLEAGVDWVVTIVKDTNGVYTLTRWLVEGKVNNKKVQYVVDMFG